MKSLDTLIKLQKTRVDEQRQALARTQAHLEHIETGIAQLEIKKAREQTAVTANPETRLTYGAFLKAVVSEGRGLEKQRVVAQAAVEAARAKLAELFEEQKRYEIAQTSRRETEQRAERRKETIDLDEVGSISFNRSKK